MKRLLPFLLFSLSMITQAQTGSKCASDFHLQQVLTKFPNYLNTIKEANTSLNEEISRRIKEQQLNKQQSTSSQPVTIPVVIHIVLPNPASITDAQVQYQVDKLNSDFSGLNADSTNLAPHFPYNLRGHSKIRFTLARKDPRNNPTTGIERRAGATLFTGDDRDPIKLANEGGLSAWDPDRYLNIWVGNTSLNGALGYSTYPYSVAGYITPPKAFHGVVIKAGAFGNSTASYQQNRGRTLVHEIGHFFGLFHIFQGGCSNQDFSIADFDAGNTDDTPAQSAGTGSGGSAGEVSCPSGLVASGCAANPSGRLYQNYMDYTDDPCMSMFTVNQVIRMEAALDHFFPGLAVSDAASPPSVFNKDIQVLATLNPNAGDPTFMPANSVVGEIIYCSDKSSLSIAPQLIFRNNGMVAVRELEIWYSIGASQPALNQKRTLASPISYRDTASLLLIPIPLVNGLNNLKIFTKNPDAVADEAPFNDTLSLSIQVQLPQASLVKEDFENAFPSTGWNVENQDKDAFSWQQTTAASKSGQSSIFMNFYEYDRPGAVDDLVTPAINVAFADSIILNFEHAYKTFDNSVIEFSDTLEILVSEDCGASYKSIWKKGGNALATVAGSTGLINWAPLPADWLKTNIDLRSAVSNAAHAITVIFRAKNGYGQNLYLDDIAISAVINPVTDAGIVHISAPARQTCDAKFSPSMVITNLGADTLRKLSVNYSIDGGAVQTLTWFGSLKKFQTETIEFEEITVTKGIHHLKFFIHSPNDLNDEKPLNDTSNWRLMIFDEIDAPLTERFNGSFFPPAYWDTSGNGLSYNWEKRKNLPALNGYISAMNNGNTVKGSRQDLRSPVIKIYEVDSILLSFDISHVTREYPFTTSPTDTLQVLLTTDCGKTYTSIYKKWGGQLNTLKQAFPTSITRDSIGFVPTLASHWRRDTINLTKLLAGAAEFQLVFRNINNNDNNLHLANITVNEVILPDRLKRIGHLLQPNPTTGVFLIRHYLPPVNLEGIQVVNSNGHLLAIQRYWGNAPSSIPVDLTSQPPGIYIVRLKYRDRTITEKIIKVNQ